MAEFSRSNIPDLLRSDEHGANGEGAPAAGRHVHGKPVPAEKPRGWGTRFNDWFNRFLDWFEGVQAIALARPILTIVTILGLFLVSFLLMPFIGLAYFPRTDPGQFVVTVEASTGMRFEMTEQEIAKVEALIRRVVLKDELGLIVSNVGATADFSAIYTSNCILIVEFTHRLIEDDGMSVREAVSHAVRVRLRPGLMTPLATLLGLIPMALKLGEGSESYAPLARSIIGGLAVSVVLTVFIVPAAFLLVHGRCEARATPAPASVPEPVIAA